MTVVVTGAGAGGLATCTFGELQTEFYARGFDYLDQDDAGRTRAKRWLNEAYVEDVCDAEPWPFLETVATGPAPLTVSNVKDVLYVTDTDNEVRLPSSDIRDIIDHDLEASATRTGNPTSYYWDGLTTLRVYPVSTPTLTMRYIAVPTELETETDRPILPRRFCSLIIEGAVIRAYLDSDNYEAAASVQAMFDRRLSKMTDSMFSRNLDNTAYVLRTQEHDG